MTNRKSPFRHLDYRSKTNLALFAVFLFYLTQVGLALYAKNLFNTIGSDYLAFWSAGAIANQEGYARVYDLSLLAKVQKPYHETVATENVYAPIPAPYFAVFLLPFQFLALFDPAVGFGVWTILNLCLLILYLRSFLRNLGVDASLFGLCAASLLSLPVFQTLYWGQVNVWLAVCIGEFMRAAMGKRDYRSGLWLAGLLLKPQLLVLLLPALLFRREWKKLAGFTAGALGIIAVSLAMAGFGGMLALAELWRNYVSGIPTNAPENMINWRMFALRAAPLTTPAIGWTAALLGLAMTALAGIFLWRKSIFTLQDFAVRFLGILAATTTAAWHSHSHLMIVVLPPLVFLAAQNRIPRLLVDGWFFIPPTLLFAAFVLGGFMGAGILPVYGYEGLLLGLGGLTLQLSLLVWSLKATRETTS